MKNASSPPPLLPLPIVAPSALPLDDSAKGSPSLPPLAPGGTLSPTISRAPIRYNLPSAPSEIPTSEVDLEEALQLEEIGEGDHGSRRGLRSLRPGQQGFAQRLMSKYGWTKGSGLGATGAGIINPLRVQIEKQKKKPDSEGGGFAGPGGRGKIISGKREGGIETTGKFGPMTEVVVLYGMVDGMDLDAEMEGVGDGGIMQEIGEECGEKYGRVERVFIDRSKTSEIPVFVKFTSQLSALRVRRCSRTILASKLISCRLSMRLKAGYLMVIPLWRASLTRKSSRTQAMHRDGWHLSKVWELGSTTWAI